MMLQRNCLFFCYCWACHFHICLVLTSLLHYFILLFFFSFSFSLVCQCLSVVQMKYHILLLSIYCVLYFGCILKYNHTMFYALWVLCFSLKHVCISIISSSVFFHHMFCHFISLSFILTVVLKHYIFKLFTLT